MIDLKMNVPIKDIISSCRIIDYKEQEQDIYQKLISLNEEILKKVFLTEKIKNGLSKKEQEYLSNYHFNPEYMNQMTIYSEINPNGYNGEDLFISYIGPCYNSFLYNILFELNIFPKQVVKDDKSLSIELKEKIKELEEITSEEELQNKFPRIYKQYQKDTSIKLNIEEFINCQTRLYTNYIEKGQYYKAIISGQNDISEYEDTVVSNYFVKLKIELYMAYHYLIKCTKKWKTYSKIDDLRTVRNARIVLHKYLNFINNYIEYLWIIAQYISYKKININVKNLQINKNVENALDNIEIFDIDNLYENLNNLLQPDIHQIPKDLVKEDKKNQHQRRIKISALNYKKLKEKGETKNNFYIDHPCERIIAGTPQAYNAHIYPNGKVILDRKYSENDINTAAGHAIYIMNIDFFLERLKESSANSKAFVFTKSMLLEEEKNGNIERMLHKGNWKKRLEKIINQSIESEELEDNLDEVADKVKAYKKRKSY